MRKWIVLLAVGSAACFGGAHRQRWVVPATDEGGSCYRQCMAIKNQCLGVDPHNWGTPLACSQQFEKCKSTCPGAYLE